MAVLNAGWDVPAFTAACTGCGACLLTCPAHAIRPRGGGLVAVAVLCTGCGECVEICPADAIRFAEDSKEDECRKR